MKIPGHYKSLVPLKRIDPAEGMAQSPVEIVLEQLVIIVSPLFHWELQFSYRLQACQLPWPFILVSWAKASSTINLTFVRTTILKASELNDSAILSKHTSRKEDVQTPPHHCHRPGGNTRDRLTTANTAKQRNTNAKETKKGNPTETYKSSKCTNIFPICAGYCCGAASTVNEVTCQTNDRPQ